MKKNQGKTEFIIIALLFLFFSLYKNDTVYADISGSQPINAVFTDPYAAEKVRLKLGRSGITDLITQSDLDGIVELNLSTPRPTLDYPAAANAISSIEGLQHLNNLKILSIGGSKVTDITPIKDLISIENFTFASSDLVNLSPLKNLVNLKTIYGSYTKVFDISSLSGKNSLTSLTMLWTYVSDITPLKNLTSLESLYIGRDAPTSPLVAGNFIEGPWGISQSNMAEVIPSLPSLKKMNIRGNQVTDPSIFSDLSNKADPIFNVLATDQYIHVEPISIVDGVAKMVSPIKDETGATLQISNTLATDLSDPEGIFDGGTFNSSTGEITWTSLTDDDEITGFIFKKQMTIAGKTFNYQGYVFVPIRPKIKLSLTDVKYPIDISPAVTISDLETKLNPQINLDHSTVAIDSSDFTLIDWTTEGTYPVKVTGKSQYDVAAESITANVKIYTPLSIKYVDADGNNLDPALVSTYPSMKTGYPGTVINDITSPDVSEFTLDVVTLDGMPILSPYHVTLTDTTQTLIFKYKKKEANKPVEPPVVNPPVVVPPLVPPVIPPVEPPITPAITKYQILYYGNENTAGTAPIDNNFYQLGDNVILLGNNGQLQRIGYKFLGWSKTKEATQADYLPGSIFVIGNNENPIVLYAVWGKNSTSSLANTNTVTNTEKSTVILPQTGESVSKVLLVLGCLIVVITFSVIKFRSKKA